MKPKCRVCRKDMVRQPVEMGRIPIEITMMLIDWGLSLEAVDYFICPEFHTQSWVLKKRFTGKKIVVDRKFEELVDKPF